MENNKVDKNDVLKGEIFSYTKSKNRKVFIFWNNKQVKILKDDEADKFLSKIENADSFEQQLIMAKITGNFKRGNEKHRK